MVLRLDLLQKKAILTHAHWFRCLKKVHWSCPKKLQKNSQNKSPKLIQKSQKVSAKHQLKKICRFLSWCSKRSRLFKQQEARRLEKIAFPPEEQSFPQTFLATFSAGKIFQRPINSGLLNFNQVWLLKQDRCPVEQRVTSKRASSFKNEVSRLPKLKRFLAKKIAANLPPLSYAQ